MFSPLVYFHALATFRALWHPRIFICITIAFIGGAVAGDTVSVTQMQTAPQELPTTATFDHPLYYLNIETTASDYNTTLCFGYTESLLQAKGVSESELGVAFWDEADSIWKSVPVTVDSTEKTVTVNSEHLSLWALVSTTEELMIGIQDVISVEGLPDKFALEQNYPNPFNPTTTISYQLPTTSFVKLSIYDISGRLVEILVNEMKNDGCYLVVWNAEQVSSGIYFYRIDAGEFSSVKKCLVVK